MTENETSNIVIGCALSVHSALGPGLLESAYAACLFYELVNTGLFVEAQKPLPLVYHDVKLECGYRIDLMVERKLILEIKSVECLNDIHLAGSDLSEIGELSAWALDEFQRPST